MQGIIDVKFGKHDPPLRPLDCLGDNRAQLLTGTTPRSSAVLLIVREKAGMTHSSGNEALVLHHFGGF